MCFAVCSRADRNGVWTPACPSQSRGPRGKSIHCFFAILLPIVCPSPNYTIACFHNTMWCVLPHILNSLWCILLWPGGNSWKSSPISWNSTMHVLSVRIGCHTLSHDCTEMYWDWNISAICSQYLQRKVPVATPPHFPACRCTLAPAFEVSSRWTVEALRCERKHWQIFRLLRYWSQ